MTDRIRNSWLRVLTVFALSSPFALGCAEGGTSGPSGTGGIINIDLDGSIPMGCLALEVPAEEPHLTGAPTFTSGAVFPTFPVEAEVGVDGETRTMKVELKNVFFRDLPPVGTVEEQVRGTQTFALAFPTEASTEGMFFMEITLCAGECDERRFVYTFKEEEDFPDTYQRLLFEGNAEIERMETCIDVPTVIVD